MIYTKKILYKNRHLIRLYIISGIAIAYLTNYSANFMEVLVNRFGSGTLKVNDIAIYGIVLIALCVLNYLDNYPTKRLEEELYIDYKLTAMEKLSRIAYRRLRIWEGPEKCFAFHTTLYSPGTKARS